MIETTAFDFLPGERGGRCTGGGKRGGHMAHYILQSEKHKVGIANKNRALTGI